MNSIAITVFVFFLGGFPWLLCGQAVDAEVQARAYFEAGDYSHAKNTYEDLLDDGMDSWKKEITDYNIATALLAGGSWEEAIPRFDVLSEKDKALPLLAQRLSSNLALAQIMQLRERLKVLKDNANANHDDYNQMYALFRTALQDINQATTDWCELELIEGASECSPSAYLREMDRDVKSHLDVFLNEYLAFRLAHVNIQEGISALVYGENSLLSRLTMMQEHPFSEDIKEKYLIDYLEQAKSWKVLWEKLEGLFKSQSKTESLKKEKGLFDHSRKLFFDSLSQAEQKDFTGSIKQLNMSKASLDELLHQFIKGNSLKEVVHQLLITYGLALIKEPLQEAYLSQIVETQAALEEPIKKSDNPAIEAAYEKAQHYLTLSVQSINEFQAVKARLFAEVARFYLKEISEQLDFTPKTQASAVLENAIAKQEFVLLLDTLKRQLPEDEKDLAEADRLMPELQQSTLNAADLFPIVVLEKQKEAFSADSTEKNRCQCRPWDEVIPLFSQGYAHAELAYRRLQAGSFNPGSIRRQQKSAVDKWKEALLKMRSSPSAAQQEKQQQQQQQEQKQSAQPEMQKDQLQEKQQNAKLNGILRLVQDMENDDRSQPQQLKTTGSKVEERPW